MLPGRGMRTLCGCCWAAALCLTPPRQRAAPQVSGGLAAASGACFAPTATISVQYCGAFTMLCGPALRLSSHYSQCAFHSEFTANLPALLHPQQPSIAPHGWATSMWYKPCWQLEQHQGCRMPMARLHCTKRCSAGTARWRRCCCRQRPGWQTCKTREGGLQQTWCLAEP